MFTKRSKTVPPQSQLFACICFFLVLVSIDICSGRRCPVASKPSRPVSREDNPHNRRFPYICNIRNPEDSEHECGGTLINGRWLLTAAHCVDPNDTNSVGTSPLIYCGIHRRNDDRKSKMYSARATYLHGSWKSNEIEKGFDIGLIELERVADLDVPKLDVAGSLYISGTRFSIVGWELKENHAPANVLHIGLNLDFVPNDICSKEELWGGDVKNSMICAGTGLTDTRKGDPGGPLLILDGRSGNHKDGDPRGDRLVGIASFGLHKRRVGEEPKPGVYTSVAFFRQWIDCVIEGNNTNDECSVKYVPNFPAADPSLISLDLPVASPEIEESVPAHEEEDETLEALSDEFEEEEDLERMKKAIEIDDYVTVGCILAQGMDPNTKYIVVESFLPINTSLLHQAAFYKAVESAKVLVDHEADVDIRDSRQRTPLHIAAEYDSLRVAKVLVDKGAKLNVKSKRGDSPLHYAAYYRHESIAKFLIEKGADVNLQNVNKETPFDVVCRGREEAHCNYETRARLESLLSTD